MYHLAQPFHPHSLSSQLRVSFTTVSSSHRTKRANKLGGRLNNRGLVFRVRDTRPRVVNVSVDVDRHLFVFVLAANTWNKSVSAPCITTRLQLLLVFKQNAGVSALVFVEVSLYTYSMSPLCLNTPKNTFIFLKNQQYVYKDQTVTNIAAHALQHTSRF